MRLVAYLRVSTQEQATSGSGLDVQREQVTTWADANGHDVVSWFVDEGISGSHGLESRPGIFDAMSALSDAEGLVVPKLDRLARSLAVQETLLAQADRLGAQVFSADDAENEYLNDDDEPTRRLIRQVLGAVAEWERGMIAARMKAGRHHRAREGMYAFGSPPFGWRSQRTERGARLVPVDTEQATLARMRELRAQGLNLTDIADTLSREGHRTKRGGTTWNPGTVSRLLRRPTPERT
jgi:DNA invertase Pin-like site-specific DNA recombinase